MRRLALLVCVWIFAWPRRSPPARHGGDRRRAVQARDVRDHGTPRIGLVLQDKIIIDLAAANRALERNPAYPALPMPEDMPISSGRTSTA